MTLLSFLSAAGEAYRYRESFGRSSGNEDLFPPAVSAWAASVSDDLSVLS